MAVGKGTEGTTRWDYGENCEEDQTQGIGCVFRHMASKCSPSEGSPKQVPAGDCQTVSDCCGSVYGQLAFLRIRGKEEAGADEKDSDAYDEQSAVTSHGSVERTRS